MAAFDDPAFSACCKVLLAATSPARDYGRIEPLVTQAEGRSGIECKSTLVASARELRLTWTRDTSAVASVYDGTTRVAERTEPVARAR